MTVDVRLIFHRIIISYTIILATARVYEAVDWTEGADFKGIHGVKYFPKNKKPSTIHKQTSFLPDGQLNKECINNWFLYVIRCNQGKLYTGITTDVERRFAEHAGTGKKGAKYLRGKAPLTLVMKKKMGSKSAALRIESRVKKLSKIRKEMLVDGKIKIRELL